MGIVITEDEKKHIYSLYEQQNKVEGFQLDKESMSKIENDSLMKLEDKFSQEYIRSNKKEELNNKIKSELNPKSPLTDLVNMGITPYVFAIPNFQTENSIPTTGINFKVGDTPFSFSLNLGVDPRKLFDSMKWSMMGVNLNF